MISLITILFVTHSHAADINALPVCSSGEMEVQSCFESRKPKKEECKALYRKSKELDDKNEQARYIKSTVAPCIAELKEMGQTCRSTAKQAEAVCQAAIKEAEAKKAQEEEAARVADEKAQNALNEKKRADADIKRLVAEQAPAAVLEAPKIEKRVAEKVETDETKKRDAAIQNSLGFEAAASMAQDLLSSIQAAKKKGTSDDPEIEATSKASETLADSILKDAPPDVGNNQPRAVKPKDQAGSPTANPGQGGSPSPQASGQQPKQDQSGGGMPSLGGLPSPSASTSSPLKVSDPPQDCSNPSVAASNPVCACRLNPTDSRCNSILAADKERREGVAKKPQVLSGETEGGGGGFSTKGGGYADAPTQKNISQHGQLEQNSGGSAGKGVGSGQGQGSSGSAKNSEGKAATYRDQTQSKSYGGGSGGGGGFGGSGGGGGQPNARIPTTFGGRVPAPTGARNVASKGRLSAAELRAQMQAQFNMRRNPAGTVGPDGITGKHTDQFKKIRTRYSEIMGN